MSSFLQFARHRVDDETAHHDVLRYERVRLDGLYGPSYRGRSILEALEPLMQVDPAFTYGAECLVGHAAGIHLMVEVVIAHVTGSAVGMGHHHDFLYAQLVDGHYQAAHCRVEG